jgi:hypothetical protein
MHMPSKMVGDSVVSGTKDRPIAAKRRYVDCAPQKLDAQAEEGVRSRPDWTCETTGTEDRQVIDLLRNVVAAVLRFFAPRAIVAAENLLLRLSWRETGSTSHAALE